MKISIHVPRVGDDAQYQCTAGRDRYFYPRPPRGGRPLSEIFEKIGGKISIHVPRVGDDQAQQFLIE